MDGAATWRAKQTCVGPKITSFVLVYTVYRSDLVFSLDLDCCKEVMGDDHSFNHSPFDHLNLFHFAPCYTGGVFSSEYRTEQVNM